MRDVLEHQSWIDLPSKLAENFAFLASGSLIRAEYQIKCPLKLITVVGRVSVPGLGDTDASKNIDASVSIRT